MRGASPGSLRARSKGLVKRRGSGWPVCACRPGWESGRIRSSPGRRQISSARSSRPPPKRSSPPRRACLRTTPPARARRSSPRAGAGAEPRSRPGGRALAARPTVGTRGPPARGAGGARGARAGGGAQSRRWPPRTCGRWWRRGAAASSGSSRRGRSNTWSSPRGWARNTRACGPGSASRDTTPATARARSRRWSARHRGIGAGVSGIGARGCYATAAGAL